MEMLVLRHGESVDDVEDCYGGIADFPLSAGGLRTAQDLAVRLSALQVDRVYSSPYCRALQTASEIACTFGLAPIIIEDLRERNSYGVLSGVTKSRARDIFAHVFRTVKGRPGDYYSDELLTGAEPRDVFDARVKAAFEAVARDSSHIRLVAIVTHGNVIRSLFRNVLEVRGKVELDLLAQVRLGVEDGDFSLLSREGITIEDSN